MKKNTLLLPQFVLSTVAVSLWISGCDSGDGNADSGTGQLDSGTTVGFETGEGEGEAGSACVPGTTLACTCADGRSGAQVCVADGSGYDACACGGGGDAGDGAETGAGSTGGSTGGGSDGGSTGLTTGDTTDTGGSTGTPTTGTDGSDSGGSDTGAAIPTFSGDIVPFFNRSCGTGVTGCHTRQAYGAQVNQNCRGWLSLEDAAIGSRFYGGMKEGQMTGCPDRTLAERLLELAPWQECAAKYVDPGNPDNSYVLNKMKGVRLCNIPGNGQSDIMPPAGKVPQADIDMVEAWILAGAPMDN